MGQAPSTSEVPFSMDLFMQSEEIRRRRLRKRLGTTLDARPVRRLPLNFFDDENPPSSSGTLGNDPEAALDMKLLKTIGVKVRGQGEDFGNSYITRKDKLTEKELIKEADNDDVDEVEEDDADDMFLKMLEHFENKMGGPLILASEMSATGNRLASFKGVVAECRIIETPIPSFTKPQDFDLMTKFKHPNIRQVHFAEFNDSVSFIVCEQVHLYLTDFIVSQGGKFTVELGLRFAFQLCMALRYIHEDLNQGHFGVLMSSILVDDKSPPNIKLDDFLISSQLHAYSGDFVPETSGTFQSVDVYMYGLVLYELLLHRSPEDNNAPDMTDIPEQFMSVLQLCFAPSADRPPMKHIMKVLRKVMLDLNRIKPIQVAEKERWLASYHYTQLYCCLSIDYREFTPIQLDSCLVEFSPGVVIDTISKTLFLCKFDIPLMTSDPMRSIGTEHGRVLLFDYFDGIPLDKIQFPDISIRNYLVKWIFVSCIFAISPTQDLKISPSSIYVGFDGTIRFTGLCNPAFKRPIDKFQDHVWSIAAAIVYWICKLVPPADDSYESYLETVSSVLENTHGIESSLVCLLLQCLVSNAERPSREDILNSLSCCIDQKTFFDSINVPMPRNVATIKLCALRLKCRLLRFQLGVLPTLRIESSRDNISVIASKLSSLSLDHLNEAVSATLTSSSANTTINYESPGIMRVCERIGIPVSKEESPLCKILIVRGDRFADLFQLSICLCSSDVVAFISYPSGDGEIQMEQREILFAALSIVSIATITRGVSKLPLKSLMSAFTSSFHRKRQLTEFGIKYDVYLGLATEGDGSRELHSQVIENWFATKPPELVLAVSSYGKSKGYWERTVNLELHSKVLFYVIPDDAFAYSLLIRATIYILSGKTVIVVMNHDKSRLTSHRAEFLKVIEPFQSENLSLYLMDELEDAIEMAIDLSSGNDSTTNHLARSNSRRPSSTVPQFESALYDTEFLLHDLAASGVSLEEIPDLYLQHVAAIKDSLQQFEGEFTLPRIYPPTIQQDMDAVLPMQLVPKK